ncbi:elongation factor P 5-aminopentanone reductase [Shimazuella kribbensis]|uniref:elongation factor P 5-aminopentanone reductase n=1 Tax=Shimazuella kribbensis TaxID=139808 RepID=UPI000409D61B|nr:3-oxoacyl-ACP reductase FabG [Shimazuella kribbensis]
MLIQDRVAWVTGASGGIGSAIAIELALVGVHVAVCYYHNKQKADEVVSQCREAGGKAISFALDVSKEEEVSQVYQAISFSLGKPTILIHAAGHTEVGLFQDATIDQYNRLMDVHVKGAFLLSKTILPYMLQEQWGRIILLSSIWGSVGGATEVLYSTAKSALHGMAKSLAKEVAPSGITVNVVAPGAIDTELLRKQLSQEESQILSEEIPVGRLGTAGEIASMVTHLCGETSSYVTGQVLHVNGGWY